MGPMRRRRVSLATALVGLLLGVVACAGGHPDSVPPLPVVVRPNPQEVRTAETQLTQWSTLEADFESGQQARRDYQQWHQKFSMHAIGDMARAYREHLTALPQPKAYPEGEPDPVGGAAAGPPRRPRPARRPSSTPRRQPHRPERLPTPHHPTAAGTTTGTHQAPPRLQRRPHRATHPKPEPRLRPLSPPAYPRAPVHPSAAAPPLRAGLPPNSVV